MEPGHGDIAAWVSGVLGCAASEVGAPIELDAGLNNRSFLIEAAGSRYVFRIPGPGTEDFVDRAAERRALQVAFDLGLDTTYVDMDAATGWKLSRYLPDARKLDYRDRHDVEQALRLVRALHTSGRSVPAAFDFINDRARLLQLLERGGAQLDADARELDALAGRLEGYLRAHEGTPVLCHNDFYGENVLIADSTMQLIDWEYAAMGQPVFDIGNFIAQGSGYTVAEALSVLDLYCERPATAEEQTLCLAATAYLGCYWYFWALCKAQVGDPVEEWLRAYEAAARRFGPAALEAIGCDAR